MLLGVGVRKWTYGNNLYSFITMYLGMSKKTNEKIPDENFLALHTSFFFQKCKK